MQVAGGEALGVDVIEDPLNLIGRQAGRLGRLGSRKTVVLGIKAKVHLVVWERKIKLVLPLGQGIRVGGGGSAADVLRHPEVFGQLIDLRLVEVGNRFHVGGTVAEFDEKTLVVLEAVGRPGHGIVQAVGMVVLQHLARALLEVGGRYDFEVRFQRQTLLHLGPIRFLGDDGKQAEALLDKHARDDDFGFPSAAVFGNDAFHGCIVAPVEPDRLEDSGDILVDFLDAEIIRNLAAELERVLGRVPLGHQQRHHPFGADGPGREREGDAAVDAAGNGHHQSAALEGFSQDVSQAAADFFGFSRGVDVEPGSWVYWVY